MHNSAGPVARANDSAWEWDMEETELTQWSDGAYAQLRHLERRKHSPLPMCCRASINGAVQIEPYEDRAVLREYTPKLIYCPECGARLDFSLRDEPTERNEP